MIDLLANGLVLAQEAQEKAPGAENAPNPLVSFLPLMVIGVLFYFMLVRPRKSEQKRHEQMVSDLKKNDRIVTIGGILGTVANVSSDGTEITVKVDDNTRIRFRSDSIRTVLKDEDGAKTTAEK